MRAALIQRQGEPVADNVRLVEDHPEPRAGPGQVLIRTHAAALNHLDLWVGRGVPGLTLEYPRISGSDACGVVEAAGDDVDSDWLGKRVVFSAGKMKPVIDSVWDCEDVSDAYARLESGEHFGKVVVRWG